MSDKPDMSWTVIWTDPDRPSAASTEGFSSLEAAEKRAQELREGGIEKIEIIDRSNRAVS